MKQRSIVCLGDSLTYGYPYGPHASWVAYAARVCDCSLINAGINGDTMDGMADRFDRYVLGRKPQAVIILGGTNDAFSNEISREMTLSSLREMIGKASECQIALIIGLPIPVDDPSVSLKLERICQEYSRISKESGARLLDFRSPFIDPLSGLMKEELYVDGVHPNKDGYQVMGESAVAFLQSFCP